MIMSILVHNYRLTQLSLQNLHEDALRPTESDILQFRVMLEADGVLRAYNLVEWFTQFHSVPTRIMIAVEAYLG